jgi:phosphate transport system permease protein
MKAKRFMENAIHGFFLLMGLVTVGCVLLISVYLVVSGIPAIREIGLVKFLFGPVWNSNAAEPQFGILPFILTSIYGTAGAILLGVPVGYMTAVFLAKMAPPKLKTAVSAAVSLLAGIPSIIYGFFGMVIIRPFIAQLTGGLGFGALTAWFVLAIMIVPTITTLTIDALNSIPMGIREASYAMGATKWQTIYKVVLPAAKLGIVDAIVLGMGRAIGETMAVLMVVGNAPVIPDSISSPISTLTSQIALDMSYSSGLHRSALFGMGVVLFIISAALVGIVRLISKKRG